MFLTLLARFWYIPAMLVMALAIHHYRSQVEVVTARYEAFQSEVKALGEQAKAHKIEVEAKNEKAIADAVGSRNAALASLRLAEANARSRSMPLTPASPAGSSQICFDPPALSSAVEQYRGRVLGLVTQGDEAQIDAATLLKSWPTTAPAK